MTPFVQVLPFILSQRLDCFQRNADACCPPGLSPKKVADVRLSAGTYTDLTERHNSSNTNTQPLSV